MWREILKREVETKGSRNVERELGYSRTAVYLTLQGTYKGSTDKIEARVMAVYGNDGNVDCAVLGTITPARCIETWQKAKTIGMQASNPDTLRLYAACKKCKVRG